MRYMKDLGITHVQIMPAYDYGSVNEAGKDTEFNWGYDPVNYNVPEGSYSTDPRSRGAHPGDERNDTGTAFAGVPCYNGCGV